MGTLIGSMVLPINVLQTMPKCAPTKDGQPSTGGFALKLALQSPTISIEIMLRVKVVTLSWVYSSFCIIHLMLPLSIGVMACNFWIKLAVVFPSIPCKEGPAQRKLGAKLLTLVSSDLVGSNQSGSMILTSLFLRIRWVQDYFFVWQRTHVMVCLCCSAMYKAQRHSFAPQPSHLSEMCCEV